MDLSLGGAALDLVAARHSETVAPVVLELRTHDGTGGIQLRCHVRHSSDNDDGTVRVGIEFVDVTPLERDVLDSLLAIALV